MSWEKSFGARVTRRLNKIGMRITLNAKATGPTCGALDTVQQILLCGNTRAFLWVPPM